MLERFFERIDEIATEKDIAKVGSGEEAKRGEEGDTRGGNVDSLSKGWLGGSGGDEKHWVFDGDWVIPVGVSCCCCTEGLPRFSD